MRLRPPVILATIVTVVLWFAWRQCYRETRPRANPTPHASIDEAAKRWQSAPLAIPEPPLPVVSPSRPAQQRVQFALASVGAATSGPRVCFDPRKGRYVYESDASATCDAELKQFAYGCDVIVGLPSCTPPSAMSYRDAPVPYNGPVRYAGEVKRDGATYWSWSKSGNPPRACNATEIGMRGYAYACNLAIGQTLYLTPRFYSIELNRSAPVRAFASLAADASVHGTYDARTGSVLIELSRVAAVAGVSVDELTTHPYSVVRESASGERGFWTCCGNEGNAPLTSKYLVRSGSAWLVPIGEHVKCGADGTFNVASIRISVASRDAARVTPTVKRATVWDGPPIGGAKARCS